MTPSLGNTPDTPTARRFVVVDDEDSVRFVLRRMIERLGYVVGIAASSAELWALLESEKEPFDGMFIDIRLGVESGLELAATLRQRQPKIGLVGMGGALDTDARAAIDNGVLDALLAKPFAFADLKSALAHLELGWTTTPKPLGGTCFGASDDASVRSPNVP